MKVGLQMSMVLVEVTALMAWAVIGCGMYTILWLGLIKKLIRQDRKIDKTEMLLLEVWTRIYNA